MNTMIDSNALISGENASSMTLAKIGMRAKGSQAPLRCPTPNTRWASTGSYPP